MASIYSKRKILYMSWYEQLLSGERIRKRESLQLKDTRENRKLANAIKKRKENKILFSHTKVRRDITIDEAYKIFIETKKEKAKSTIEYYEYALRLLVQDYGKIKANYIGSDEINEIVKKFKDLSKESIVSYKKGMKIFFNYLIQEKYISENPVGKIEMIRNRKVEVMTDEELKAILYHFENRNKDHYNFIKCLVLSGFRISEAISLEWGDIKSDHIIVKNEKGRRKDYFPLTKEIREHLGSIEKKAEHVFIYKDRHSVKYLGNKIAKFTNKKYSFHSFRKKFGTEWSRRLMPAELKVIMRHNDVRTTMEYYVGIDAINIGEKMAVSKWGLNEQRKDEKCQIINIKTHKNSYKTKKRHSLD